jgi:hypothetical protein
LARSPFNYVSCADPNVSSGVLPLNAAKPKLGLGQLLRSDGDRHPGSFAQGSPRRGYVFARLVQSLHLLMAWALVIIEPVGPQLFLNLCQDVIGLLTDFLKCWCVHLSIHLISGAVSAGSDYSVTSPPTLPTETMVSVLEKLKLPSSFPCPTMWGHF